MRLLHPEGNTPERVHALRGEPLPDRPVINRTQPAQVECHRIDALPLAHQKVPELQNGRLVQLAQLVMALPGEPIERDQCGTVGPGRAVAALPEQLLDLPTEDRMHVTVVITAAESARHILSVECFPATLQFRDDAVDLVELMAQVTVHVVRETPLLPVLRVGNRTALHRVELFGQQLERREDHTTPTGPEDLDHQRITVAGRVLADVEHRTDARAAAFGARLFFLLFYSHVYLLFLRLIIGRAAKLAYRTG